MYCKHKKQTILIAIILFSLIIQLSIRHIKAETPIVTGSNFQLYFPANTQLAFQHLSIPWETKGATITLTVSSGTLNGTSATLKMYSTDGVLTFLSQDTCTITLISTSNSTNFWINDVCTANAVIQKGGCTIKWSILEPEFLLPILFILGMFGLGSMFIGPSYAIYKVKHKEYYDGLTTGLIVTVLGIALTIMWLWT